MRRLSIDQIRARRDSRIARAHRQDDHGHDRADVNWRAAERWDRALLSATAAEHDSFVCPSDLQPGSLAELDYHIASIVERRRTR